MTTQRKVEAVLTLAAIAGASIALRRATVSNGAVLGLSPMLAVTLMAGAVWAVPKLMEAR